MHIARILLAAGALALCACATPAKSNPSVADTRWAAKGETSVDPRQVPRLQFLAEGKLTGYTGCNRMAGAWRLEGDEIKVSELSSTKRACLGPGAEVERRFTTALGGRINLEGEKLVVSSGNERVELVRE